MQQNFVVGHTVNITCVADGFPEPTYTWLQGGKYIVPTERMFYTHGVLTIRNIQRADEGNYECLAKNTAGEDIALSRLTYIGILIALSWGHHTRMSELCVLILMYFVFM